MMQGLFHPPHKFDWVRFGILSAIFLLVAYLLGVALLLKIDYFDVFTIFHNSRAVASLNGAAYFWKRFMFLPLLLSPIFYLERIFSLENFGFVVSHFLAVCSFAVLLRLLYRLFCLYLKSHEALWGVFLFSLNRLIIHQAPFAKEDIPATLFVTAAFYFYLKNRQSHRLREKLLVSFFIAASMATRYNLIPLLFLVIAAYEVIDARKLFGPSQLRASLRKPESYRSLFFFFFLPVLMFFALPCLLYSLMGITSFFGAVPKFVGELFLVKQLNARPEPPLQNYIFLIRSCTWPVMVCALAGLGASCQKRYPGTLFFLLWLAIFFIFQTYYIDNKEARYLFPLMPPLYYFVARGIGEAQKIAVRLQQPFRKAALAGFSLIILIAPGKLAVSECLKFRDPVYRTDFPKCVADYAKDLAGTHRIFWVGPFYPLHPEDYIFHPDDEFTYIYHFYAHVVEFHARKRVMPMHECPLLGRKPGRDEIFFHTEVIPFASDKDVLIVNPEPLAYNTRELPDRLQPLVVQRQRHLYFYPVEKSDPGQNDQVFEGKISSTDTTAALKAYLAPGGYVVEGEGIPDGRYFLYVDLPMLDYPFFFASLDVRAGRFRAQNQQANGEIAIERIWLLYFDRVKKFSRSQTGFDA